MEYRLRLSLRMENHPAGYSSKQGDFMALRVIGQIVDFFWKAALAYAATLEGQKELNDIVVAAGLESEVGLSSTPASPVRTRPQG